MDHFLQSQNPISDQPAFDKCFLVGADNSVGNGIYLGRIAFRDYLEDNIYQGNGPELRNLVSTGNLRDQRKHAIV
jgi:hypothetical protein